MQGKLFWTERILIFYIHGNERICIIDLHFKQQLSKHLEKEINKGHTDTESR